MSSHDFSGIDERRGRWWGPFAWTLTVLGLAGALGALLVLAVLAAHAIED